MRVLGKNLENADVFNRLRGALHSVMPVNLQLGKRTGDFEPIERDGLRAQCLRDWPEDPSFIQQWDALSRGGPSPHPFAGPIWQRAMLRHLAAAGSLRVIAVWRGQHLKAVFPLVYRANATLETPHRWVSDYLDPPVDATEAAACWNLMLELLARLWDWSVNAVVFPHIRPELNCRTLLPELAAAHGFKFGETPAENIARIQLPETFDAYMALHSSPERKNTLRKMRKAVGQANAKLVEITDAPRGMEVLKVVLDQVEAGKKQSKANFVRRVIRPLMTGASPDLFSSGWLKAMQLQIFDARPAANLLVFDSAVGPQIYNASYDESCKEWSPGSVLFAMTLQQAIERKAKVFDLMRGDEEYKKRMHASIEPLYTVTLHRA